MASPKRPGRPFSAAEFLDRLNADAEHQRQKAEHDAGLQERAEALQRAEEPIVRELHIAGCDVSSVWDLVNSSAPYPDALPVLLEHLSRGGYLDRVMESLGRALAVRPASFAWTSLRELYLRADGRGEEEGLAVALSASAGKEHLDGLIELLADDTRGESRIHFLRPIRRLGGEQGVRVIESLLHHPLFGNEAAARLKSTRRQHAR